MKKDKISSEVKGLLVMLLFVVLMVLLMIFVINDTKSNLEIINNTNKNSYTFNATGEGWLLKYTWIYYHSENKSIIEIHSPSQRCHYENNDTSIYGYNASWQKLNTDDVYNACCTVSYIENFDEYSYNCKLEEKIMNLSEYHQKLREEYNKSK